MALIIKFIWVESALLVSLPMWKGVGEFGYDRNHGKCALIECSDWQVCFQLVIYNCNSGFLGKFNIYFSRCSYKQYWSWSSICDSPGVLLSGILCPAQQSR